MFIVFVWEEGREREGEREYLYRVWENLHVKSHLDELICLRANITENYEAKKLIQYSVLCKLNVKT